MENGNSGWRFKGSDEATGAAAETLKKHVYSLFANCSKNVEKTVLPPAPGDPSDTPCLAASVEAEDAVVNAIRSGNANSYAPSAGVFGARRAVAEYLNQDLPDKLTPKDVFMTIGGYHGIEILIQALARPNANILLPRPGFPHYDVRAAYCRLEVRKYNLLPDSDWEIDINGIEEVADENTVAVVVINPNNPCGNVYTSDHLEKVAEMAKKLRIMVISDEVYSKVVYGDNPFVPMAKFASIAPVITLGSLSKGWNVPGWRLGWITMHDPNGIFTSTGIVQSITEYLDISPQPATIVQEALPQILENTSKEKLAEKNKIMKQNVDFAFDCIEAIPSLACPKKPESCSYIWTKIDLSLLDGIANDTDFCVKLAREENLVLVPGVALGLENWLRISLGIDPLLLKDVFDRLNIFCLRHAIKEL